MSKSTKSNAKKTISKKSVPAKRVATNGGGTKKSGGKLVFASSRVAGLTVGSDTTSLLSSLKSARQTQGISQKALGKKLGVSTGTVATWEAGHGNPRKGALQKIRRFLSNGSVRVNGASGKVPVVARKGAVRGDLFAKQITEAVLASPVMARVSAFLDACSGGKKLTLVELAEVVDMARGFGRA